MNVQYHGPVMIDDPERFELSDFVRNAVALDAQRVFYFNRRLFVVDYETLHGIYEDRFVVVEVITYSAFAEVEDFRRWLLYHSNDDSFEYTDSVSNLRGDTAIIPVVKSSDRFVRKIEEHIEKGKFRSGRE